MSQVTLNIPILNLIYSQRFVLVTDSFGDFLIAEYTPYLIPSNYTPPDVNVPVVTVKLTNPTSLVGTGTVVNVRSLPE